MEQIKKCTWFQWWRPKRKQYKSREREKKYGHEYRRNERNSPKRPKPVEKAPLDYIVSQEPNDKQSHEPHALSIFIYIQYTYTHTMV